MEVMETFSVKSMLTHRKALLLYCKSNLQTFSFICCAVCNFSLLLRVYCKKIIIKEIRVTFHRFISSRQDKDHLDERRQTSAKYYFFKASFFLSLSPNYAIEDVAIGMFTFLIHLLNAYKNEISIVFIR